uniref:Uncharacterized protein n=1 Tax=Nothobranchius furzeri TaxID=105023 RepID=A0A8C6LD15_NOTFU
MEPIFTDGMQTPKLSDFGLSKMQLQRALAGADWCSDVPPMPKMSLPCPSLNIPASPPMPLTPKRALRMDDEELQEPQMHDFGISEHNMPLNNDFTMNLLLKTQRSPPDIVVPPSLKEGVQTAAGKLQSALWTPGFKMKKPNAHYSTPKQDKYDPESSGQTCDPPVTPQVPAFKTPYVNRLVSTKKSAQPEPTSCNGSKLRWECNVPEISVGFEDKQMPELPNLESFLGNSLQNVRLPKKQFFVSKLQATSQNLKQLDQQMAFESLISPANTTQTTKPAGLLLTGKIDSVYKLSSCRCVLLK